MSISHSGDPPPHTLPWWQQYPTQFYESTPTAEQAERIAKALERIADVLERRWRGD